MGDFVKVAEVGQIPDPGKATFEVDDRLIVVVCANGLYYCLDDVCTHDGGPLGDGEIDDGTISCPRHGAKFDLKTGEALTMPATEPTAAHQVKVDGTAILVKLAEL